MAKKIPHAQECSAASDLLRHWGTCPESAFVPKQVILPVIERYAAGVWYHYGVTLFNHLAAAATLPNRWIIPGPGNPAKVLEEFLKKTTCPADPMTRSTLRKEFDVIVDETERQYGVRLEYNDALNPFVNIKAARKEGVRLWAAERAVKKGVKEIGHG
jgi:hypothetical protein